MNVVRLLRDRGPALWPGWRGSARTSTGDERRCPLQVTQLREAAMTGGTAASGRLAQTFEKLRDEYFNAGKPLEQPKAPTGVEEPPFGP